MLDERGLEVRVDRFHDGVVDVALEAGAVDGFDFVFGEDAVVEDRDAGLLDVGHVDEHDLGHVPEKLHAGPARTRFFVRSVQANLFLFEVAGEGLGAAWRLVPANPSRLTARDPSRINRPGTSVLRGARSLYPVGTKVCRI